MKKFYLFALALVCALATGCKDDEAAENVTPEDSNTNAMTADQQKDYLEKTGKEILNSFNTNDQKEAVALADGLYRKYEDYNWEAIADKLADIDDGRYQNLFSAPKRLIEMTQGLRVPTANDVIVFSFEDGAYNFEIDEKKQTINYSPSTDGTCTATFRDEKGNTCTLRAWGEGKTAEYSYSYRSDGSTKTIKAKVPATTHVTLKQGNTEVINFTFGLDAQKNNHIYVTTNLKVTNVLVKYDIRVNSTYGSAIYELKYGDKNMISAAVDLPKYRLIDKGDNQDWENWLEQYEERYEELLRAIGSGSAQLNLMDLVTVKASINSGADLYTTFASENDIYTKSGCQEFCKAINDNCSAGLYFPSDPSTLQVEIRMQPRAYEGYVYDPKTQQYVPGTEYEPEPVLYFPKDRTSYAMEEYFTQNRFSSLMQLAENVVNSYIDLDNEFGLEHIDF